MHSAPAELSGLCSRPCGDACGGCYSRGFQVPFLIVLLAAAVCAAQEPPSPPPARVIVTGTYEPVALEEADRPVAVLPVREQLLLLNTNVDLLRLDPSIDLRQRSPNNIQTDISIRGAGFGQTLVLWNGLRLNDVQSGHHSMNFPAPLESLDRIEVLKGSGSTLYGSDALGGVVHFVSRRPETTEIRLRSAGGNFGVNQQRVSLSYAQPKWSQSISASRDFSKGFIPNRDYRNLALSSLTYIGSTGITLAYSDRPFGAEQFYGNFNSWERTKTWFAGINQQFGERTTASFGYRRNTDLFVLYRDRPQVYTNHHISETMQGVVRRTENLAANVRLHYGVEGNGDWITSSNLGRHSRARGAGYAALDIRALRRYSFNLGIREELYSSFNSQWSPSAAFGVWLSPHLKARAGVSRAFRVPTYTDLYYRDPATLGNPSLRAEKAWTYEAGLDFAPSSGTRLEATLFQRRETDGIDYVRLAPSMPFQAMNFTSLRFTGLEVSGSQRLREHVLNAGITVLRNRLASEVESRYISNFPRQNTFVGWHGPLAPGWQGRSRVGVLTRTGRSTYGVWDFYAARTAGAWHPFVQLGNVTNTRYEEIRGVVMPGRSVVVGLDWTWRDQ